MDRQTCRWGSSLPSRSRPPQPYSHWPHSAPGSSGGTAEPPVSTHLNITTPGKHVRETQGISMPRTLEVRSRWKMPLECR